MSSFDPTTSDLANIPIPTLIQWQADAMTALHQLSIGGKGEAYSYTQGDGAKSVTYTRANINDLRAWVAKLNAQLGMGSGRRPMRVIF
jgi:hypothetical protein